VTAKVSFCALCHGISAGLATYLVVNMGNCVCCSQDTAPEEHQRSSPEESSVIEVSEDDFRAWAVVMRGRIKQ